MVIHGDYFLLLFSLNTCPANHKSPSVTKYMRNSCKNHKVPLSQLSVTRMLRKSNSEGVRHRLSRLLVPIINLLQNWNHPLGQRVQGQGSEEWQLSQSTG